MDFETLDNTGAHALNAEVKEQFRNSSKWMNIYSILLFIFLGLGGLILIIFLLAGGVETITNMAQGRMSSDERKAFEILMPMLKIIFPVILVFLVFYFLGATKLFRTAQKFSNVAVTGNSDDIIQGFSNYRKFWMILGIITIVMIVFMVILVGTMIPTLMQNMR